MSFAKKHIAVLLGGWSAERDVSLISGQAIGKALQELGHKVTMIDVKRDCQELMQQLDPQRADRPDVVFNALHGRGGEDGVMQGLLEFLQIPYTHSPVMASALAMDKPTTKNIVTTVGVPCPEGFVLSRSDIKQRGYPLPPPFVIKPPNEGSSVGIRIIRPGDNLDIVDEKNWLWGDKVLIEKYIKGRELTVGLMGDQEQVKALAVTELRSKKEFYDYEAKYTDGVTEHLIPAPIPPDVYEAALRLAEKAYRAIGCQGVARVDFRYDDTLPGTSGLYFLELNTQPGFTPLSLLPEQARYVSISFNDLVQWIVEHPVCPS
jgi:D-alanine-D-alanine ligase